MVSHEYEAAQLFSTLIIIRNVSCGIYQNGIMMLKIQLCAGINYIHFKLYIVLTLSY